jgi:S-adenosylmethionine decarboxylase
MKKIAPEIVRQRLLIERYFTRNITRDVLSDYLFGVAEHLNLKVYGEPTIFSPAGIGKEENQGFDAFIPLIDSGISAYVWSKNKFFSVILYTCKNFDTEAAITYTKKYFEVSSDMVFMEF